MARSYGVSGLAIAAARMAQSFAARFRKALEPAAPPVKIKRKPFVRPRDGFLSMAMGPRQQMLQWRKARHMSARPSQTLRERDLLNRFGKPHTGLGTSRARRITKAQEAAR